MLKASELKVKDVINVADGKRLGVLADVEIDLASGRIQSIVVPGPGRLFGILPGGEDVVIPWNRIVKIGPDCILVNLDGQS